MLGKSIGKKRSRRSVHLGISSAALGLGLISIASRQAQAEPVDLGGAGPNNWAVFDDGVSIQSLSGSSTINGNIGTYFNEGFSLSGTSAINGNFVSDNQPFTALTLNGTQVSISGIANLDDGGTASYNGGASSSQIAGGVSFSSLNNPMLDAADADALNAQVTARDLSPTQTVSSNVINVTSGTTTITGTAGVNVIDVNSLNVDSGASLVLTAPTGGSFVINDKGNFTVNGHITVAGGLDGFNVLYDLFLGGVNYQLNGTADGVVLDQGFNPSGFDIAGGTLNGELIILQDNDLLMSDGAAINDTDVNAPAIMPEPASLGALGVGSAALLLRRRRRAI